MSLQGQGLQGQVVVVTGAAGELGRAICRALLAGNATVVMIDCDREALIRASAKLEFGAGRTVPLPADVTNENQVRAAFDHVRTTLARVDLLVNNASRQGTTALTADVTRAQWEEVLSVNLTGAFLCCREALKFMQPAGRGKIINISSVAGRTGYPARSAYCASNWGLVGLTLTMAQEYGRHNIQVNAICPGPMEGERTERLVQARAQKAVIPLDQARAEFVRASALRRLVKPDDAASMVAYLASAAGDNITAQVLEVSAGWAPRPTIDD